MSKAAERTIEAISNNAENPFWSVMIPTRGCSPYLEQTLLSVREQDPGPKKMQIAIVNDALAGDFVRRPHDGSSALDWRFTAIPLPSVLQGIGIDASI
jgi:cellulose synthase/poly-beta-1,6-N-acetylglucosamine synthase-like glycosyltransferase